MWDSAGLVGTLHESVGVCRYFVRGLRRLSCPLEDMHEPLVLADEYEELCLGLMGSLAWIKAPQIE